MNDGGISEKLLEQARQAVEQLREGKPVKIKCVETGETLVILPPIDNSELSDEGKKLLGIEE